MHRLAPVIALLGLGGAALSGCGGGDDLSGDYSVSASLRGLPYVDAAKGTVSVVTADLEHATKLAGAKRPKDGDANAIVSWLKKLNGDVSVPAAQAVGLESAASDPTGKLLGFTAADVRSYAEATGGDIRSFTVESLYDGAELKGDLPVKNDLKQTAKGDPGKIPDDLGDSAAVAQFPFVTAIGKDGDRLALSADADRVHDWQDGKGKRLDDSGELAAVAKALDDKLVYAAVLVAGRLEGGRPSPSGSDDATLEEPFDAVGVGFTYVHKVPEAHVCYHFPGDAAAASDQLRELWGKGVSSRTQEPLSDYVKVEDVKAHGKIVTVDLDASERGPGVVVQMLTGHDTPFVSPGT